MSALVFMFIALSLFGQLGTLTWLIIKIFDCGIKRLSSQFLNACKTLNPIKWVTAIIVFVWCVPSILIIFSVMLLTSIIMSIVEFIKEIK